MLDTTTHAAEIRAVLDLPEQFDIDASLAGYLALHEKAIPDAEFRLENVQELPGHILIIGRRQDGQEIAQSVQYLGRDHIVIFKNWLG